VNAEDESGERTSGVAKKHVTRKPREGEKPGEGGDQHRKNALRWKGELAQQGERNRSNAISKKKERGGWNKGKTKKKSNNKSKIEGGGGVHCRTWK